jgi:hypothetical protein
MKTVLSIWHIADKGKTETLRELAKLFLTTYPDYRSILPIPTIVPDSEDFRLVIEINGKIIGIESQGDPTTNLENRLIELADTFNCEIIICSSRTRGDTISAVDNLWETRGFQTIWTSTYQIADKTLHKFVNELKAKHILDLLQGLGLI